MFRDLFDVAEMLGERVVPGGVLTINTGTYVVHASIDDGIVHLAELSIDGIDDLALLVRCRGLVIDGNADALVHLRRPEVPVDCMACLVRGLGR